MPLLRGHSNDIVSANISELVHSGYSEKQAVAIAMKKAGRARSNEKKRVEKKIASHKKSIAKEE